MTTNTEITPELTARWIAIDRVIEDCGMPSQEDHDFYNAYAEVLAAAGDPAFIAAFPESEI